MTTFKLLLFKTLGSIRQLSGSSVMSPECLALFLLLFGWPFVNIVKDFLSIIHHLVGDLIFIRWHSFVL